MTYTVHGHVLLQFQVNIHVHELLIVTFLVRSVAGDFLIITYFCGTSNEWRNNRYIFGGSVKSDEFFTTSGQQRVTMNRWFLEAPIHSTK
jgi:hypothetical protein